MLTCLTCCQICTVPGVFLQLQPVHSRIPRALYKADADCPLTSHAGFSVADAIALLRLDDLYVECFEVKDVKVRRASSCFCIAACLSRPEAVPGAIEQAASAVLPSCCRNCR